MNFRRILLTGAALGSAAALTAACSNSDDVVLTIPTTDSAVTGNDAGPTGQSGSNREDDGRFIARCSTEADGDGFAGQTFFTDGSSDFSDYCLQRFYSGVQPAPGAVYVPRENREDASREGGAGASETPTSGGNSQPQQVPTEGQVLAEGQSNRNQNITDGGAGQQITTDGTRTGVGGEQNQATDNFGAANAGSPNRPGDNNGDNANNNGNGNGNGNGNTDNQGGNTGGNNAGGGNGGTRPTTPTSPEQGDGDDDGVTVPGLPGVTIPAIPTTPETPETTEPSTPSTPTTTAQQQNQPTQQQGQQATTTTSPQTQTPQQTQQAPAQTQTPGGTGSTQQPTPTPTQNATPSTGVGAIEDTSAPSASGQSGIGGSTLPAFPQFPQLQVPEVGQILDGISS